VLISSDDNFEEGYLAGIPVKKIDSIWFRRRPEFSNRGRLVTHPQSSFTPLVNEMNMALVNDELVVSNFLEPLLANKTLIGSMKSSSINKLHQLKIASRIGMLIPDTAVLTDKKELARFRAKHKNIIVKPLYNMSFMRYEGVSYYTYTKIVTDELMEKMPDKFSPALFQEAIDKEFEIRSFFLNAQEYSMGIFSQKNSQTMVDFRKYDREYPNRRVPFKLPKEVYSMVLEFMKDIEINTGSFDFIYSNRGEYVFLEVNPVGQFGMVSMPCNYYIEKRIAETLCHAN
jgi:ATP-GRASP peptide maturase of grasp-with-spasm system